MATTGQLIRAARFAMGLSQVALARDVRAPKITGGMVSAWEMDKCLPTPDHMDSLAKTLRTTVEALTGNGEREDGPVFPHIGRPALPVEDRKKNYKSELTIGGFIPEWIGYSDLKNLVKQWRCSFYDERSFKVWVEVGHPKFGKCPSRIDELAEKTAWPGVRRRKYNWPTVKAWMESTMIDPTEGGANAKR